MEIFGAAIAYAAPFIIVLGGVGKILTRNEPKRRTR